MPRPRSLKPKHCLDKPSGRAFVILDGAKKYLGRYGTQESRDNYDRVIGEWIAEGRPRYVSPSAANGAAGGVTVSQVIAAFWSHAKQIYPAPPYQEGKRPKGELGNYWDTLRPLRRLYGPTAAADFGPRELKAVREDMIRPKQVLDQRTGAVSVKTAWCRNVANRHIGRLKHVFKWAVEHGLVPGEVHHRLATVSGLRRGRSDARETEPVRPVPDGHIDAVLPLVSRQVRAMIQLQLLTGMRPGEVCAMRTCDIDMSGRLWTYRPPPHKTAHHGHQREVRIGPRARAIMDPFLKPDLQAPIFSPADAEADRRRGCQILRMATPQAPDLQQPEADARPFRKRPPRDRYRVASYRRAIERACARADRLARASQGTSAPGTIVPPWHPHQLRHNAATRLRREYGIEVARIILGHRSAALTEVYAEMDLAKAEQVMAEVG
jgi:integrase